ncbi:hypothetical protein RI129_001830 [Pyrocoelia pectoralis]|uniref:Pentatricopeptide repeat-containing protein-mitochondrial domain-containing protein n=1 Tax=Pyrocoelia pectoralis TaxID=417401 RepID=A0AAN7VUQ9_9COLE
MYRTTLRRIINFGNLNFVKVCGVLCHSNGIKSLSRTESNFEILKCFSSNVTAYNHHLKEDVNDMLENLRNAYTCNERIYIAAIEGVLKEANHEVLKTHGMLLMKCCGALVVDETSQTRQALCGQIFSKMKSLNIVEIEHYNTYLQVSIENKINIDYIKFLEGMSCEANEVTYKLLLKAVCEVGDIQQAFKIVTAMKENQFLANEELFNVLVLAHSIKEGLDGITPILKTMQSAQVPPSDKTFKAIIRGLALYGDKNEFIKSLQMYSNVIQENDFIHLLAILGTKGLHNWLVEVMEITNIKQISKQNMEEFILLCIRLIHAGNTEAALMYYKQFMDASSLSGEGDYAFPLLYEMVAAQIETSKIIEIIDNLKKEGLNTVALERLLGVALQKGFMESAWELLQVMPNIRPHYFWPFIMKASKEHREIGVLNILEKMLKMNVRPDIDTLQYYCLHLCDSKDPQQLLLRLQKLGLTVREILTPLLSFLIKQDRVISAINLCTIVHTLCV